MTRRKAASLVFLGLLVSVLSAERSRGKCFTRLCIHRPVWNQAAVSNPLMVMAAAMAHQMPSVGGCQSRDSQTASGNCRPQRVRTVNNIGFRLSPAPFSARPRTIPKAVKT
jgi:hypothetical protein